MLGFVGVLKRFISDIRGFSTQDIAAGMTLAVLTGSVAVVTGNAVVLDTEEKVHVFNAQTITNAVEQILLEENVTPVAGSFKNYTLQDVYDSEKLENVVDPSGEDFAAYNPTGSLIRVENAVLDDGTTERRFYALLQNIDKSYTYIDETDSNDSGRIVSKRLTKDNVNIPARDTSL